MEPLTREIGRHGRVLTSKPIRLAGTGLIAFAWLALSATPLSPAPTIHAQSHSLAAVQHFGNLPLGFEPNRGQVPDRAVEFVAHTPGSAISLLSDGIVLSQDAGVKRPSGPRLTGVGLRRNSLQANSLPSRLTATRTQVRLRFLGSRTHAKAIPLRRLPGKVNYFIGNNPRDWHANIPTYGAIKYVNVYPGIDAVFYGKAGQLSYDWLIKPGADVGSIRERYDGATTQLLGTRALLLHASGSRLIEKVPAAFEMNGEKVSVHYTLLPHHQIAFRIGKHNPNRTLVIDPSLVYSTYLGGSGSDSAASVRVGKNGDAYITGDTDSTDFPTKHPLQRAIRGRDCRDAADEHNTPCPDVFVMKLNRSGKGIVYTTYFGGTGDDEGNGIAIDGKGNAYVTGMTLSRNFPLHHAIQGKFGGGSIFGDAFVIKLSAGGNRVVYSTYLGGSGEDEGYAIAVDGKGHAYVGGSTHSTNFPLSHPLQSRHANAKCSYGSKRLTCSDAFISELSASGQSFVYSTYLGGRAHDEVDAITVRSQSAIASGITESVDFPTTAGAFQRSLHGVDENGFVAKLKPGGQGLAYSTYLGGNGQDQALAIAEDGSGNAYVGGITSSDAFPIRGHPVQRRIDGIDDGFVAKLNSGGNALIYSTYLGGDGEDLVGGIAVDGSGNAYVTGITASDDFPTVKALPSRYQGDDGIPHAFVSKLNGSGSGLIYSTYLGGNNRDQADGIAIDRSGDAYVAGFTMSDNFPGNRLGSVRSSDGAFHAFVAKIGR